MLGSNGLEHLVRVIVIDWIILYYRPGVLKLFLLTTPIQKSFILGIFGQPDPQNLYCYAL
jgi:hypothetical protein